MDSNITINIVEPGSGPVVPNTGLFTSSIGGPEITTISISAVLILTMVAIIITALLYRKQKKSGKVTKLVHLVDSTKAVLKSKKRITVGLSAIALLASAGTLTTLLTNAGKSNTNAAEEDGLTLDVTGGDITIELADEPVFAVAEVKATVKEATEAGYTLTAYTDNTDLVSTTDSSKVIPMITLPEAGGELSALTDNTYGLALEEPTTKDAEVYTTLSTDADNPTFITDKDYEHTEANDTTTIYYGFYITPDVPYGTYTGSEISYNVEANKTATVTFDGDGLYFDGDKSKTTNTVEYSPNNANAKYTALYSHTPNINDGGIQDGKFPNNSDETYVYTVPGATRLHVEMVYGGEGDTYYPSGDWVSIWAGSHPDYTAKVNYSIAEQWDGSTDGKFAFWSQQFTTSGDIEGNAVTFGYTTDEGSCCGIPADKGYGYYATITAYDADGNQIEITGKGNKTISGLYKTPDSTASHRFLGWNTNKGATTAAYSNQDDITKNLDLSFGDVILYAVYEKRFTISYNGNGADATTNMDNVEQYTSNLDGTSRVDLLASNFKKEGYGFAGWSTDQDAASKINNTGDDKPTIYGPNQMITIDENLIAEAGENRKLILNAVWVPAETNVTMQTFNPNSEPYASKPKGTVIALKDKRDNEVYAVAKLADGNYWMIENLRLDNSAELTKTEGATKGNTNNPSLPLTNNYEEQITSNKLSATSNNWCNNWSTEEEQKACYDHSNLNTNNVANTATSPVFSQDFTSSSHSSNFDGNIASYGNYYNWYSATAGNGKYETGSNVTVAGDICPAGWILPIGSQQPYTNGSFSHLDTSMGGTGDYQGSTEASNRWRSFPNNFVYSGYWFGSSAYSRGNGGYYWSSAASSTYGAYYLGFDSGYVNPGTYSYDKNFGYSVRCVAPTE